ncbi:type II secretion system protein GspK [Desulfonatronovibrio magnus]|uniref:type II secretion system protein GspK n=1 Tax=Desulfonatronovibrio magnus TaxID=698827 RepID=UPI0005EB649E|nr:type II secretion system protein GspK [Desulfonatronovibrio magnus]
MPGKYNSLSSTREKGAALILVLAGLLSLSVVVLRAGEKTAVTSREMSMLLLEYKASVMAREGIKTGLNLFAMHQEQAEELGFQPIVWSDQGLYISIIPCASKINIGAATETQAVGERFRQAIYNLLTTQGLSLNEMNSLLYWIGASEPMGPHNDFSVLQLSDALPFQPPERIPDRPEELKLVPGLENISASWISSKLTVWSAYHAIDINTASQTIVLAVLPELEHYWDQISRLRQSQSITHPNELLNRVGLDMATYTTVLPYISFQPEYFEMTVEVRQGAWMEKHRIILKAHLMDHDTAPEIVARDVLEAGKI